MAVKLGNGNWAVKEDKLLAYNDNSGLFFNKEFDFTRGSTATYVGRDGLIASAASGVPRIDFTNDTKGHLLLEPSRTNVIPYSQDFSNSAWTKERATISANTDTSPDGSVNASKIIEDTANGVHSIYEGVAISNNIYTFSCFVKKSERDYCFLQIVTNLGRYTAVFDLVNGIVTDTQTLSSPTNTSNKIEDYGNGWYRVSVTSSNTASTTGYFQVGLSDSATPSYSSFKQPTYLGDGSSGIEIWGAMAEVGDYNTSLINTTGAASTRNADVCNNSGSAQDFNSEEGVLYVEASALSNGGVNRYISLSNNTSSNRLQIIYSSNSNRLTISGVGNVGGVFTTINYTSFVQNQFNKIAIKYSSSGCKVFVNGSDVGSNTDNTSWVKNALTTFDLTLWNQSTAPFIGKVRNVQVFTEALTDEQLEKLTS